MPPVSSQKSEARPERSYWLGFSNFSGIGPGKFGKLLIEFGSAEKAWNAEPLLLELIVGKALTPKFVDFRNRFSISDYENLLKKKKVGYLTLIDKDYPVLLKQIKKPPFVLYYKGNLELLKFCHSGEDEGRLQNLTCLERNESDPGLGQDDPSAGSHSASSGLAGQAKTIAIVGTRRITDYGQRVTENLTSDLVNNGFVIVSGLALGVDATAHKKTIENKGKTIAVLGCGVDCCYPRENEAIYNSILENGGAIVSEYPLSQEPSKGSFPSRNRIIAGLSQAVIVTEGAADSGALYTADEAFALNRPVFAVPGPITSSLSKGPHSLFAKGGKLIGGAEDVLKELGILEKKKGDPPASQARVLRAGTKEEQKVIDVLQNESVHFDEIVKRTKIDSSKLGGILSMLEMKGMVRSEEAGFFCLV